MTPEQREAAIERMAEAYWTFDGSDRDAIAAALDALLENHVVLHRDDVTEEHGKLDYDGYAAQCWSGDPHAELKRLATRWESITKEDENGNV